MFVQILEEHAAKMVRLLFNTFDRAPLMDHSLKLPSQATVLPSASAYQMAVVMLHLSALLLGPQAP
jgi:hypothetical protein